MRKNIFFKVIIPLLFFLLLLSFLGLFYNHNKEAKAQYSVDLVCDEKEIPIGEAAAEATELVNVITQNAQDMVNSAMGQAVAARGLIELADQCNDASNCQTDCDFIDADGDGIVDTCDVRPCSGNPCPPQIVGKMLTIIFAYNNILGNQAAINNATQNRDDILEKLEEARKELEKCVTPAGELTEAEAAEAETLIPCHEVKYERALPEGKDDCDYPNNFYCCHFE